MEDISSETWAEMGNNKINLKTLAFEDLKMNSIDFTGSCVRLLRSWGLYSGSIKKTEIFYHLGDYQLSKKDPVSQNYLQ